MSQHYSNPDREHDPHALPDIEVFYLRAGEMEDCEPGWYWWSCFPGCMPDGDPMGLFATVAEAEAVADRLYGRGHQLGHNVFRTGAERADLGERGTAGTASPLRARGRAPAANHNDS